VIGLWWCIIAVIFLLAPGKSYAVEEYLIKLPRDFTANLKKSQPVNAIDFISSYLNTNQPVALTAIDHKQKVLPDWYLLHSSDISGINFVELKRSGRIIHYQKNNILKLHAATPDDPLYAQQWYHQKIRAYASWKFFVPDKRIIIALIDTGVDYLHPDLQGSLWVNNKEDLNGNGRLDSLDINHIDDDENGYIDDVIGWDFTDAARFPDGGDFQEPDNDPMDAYPQGHGTQIAGIIAAQANNGIGIAGLVPGCPVMNLRAGTSQGYLEEDDVARAIIYAIENNAKIINMSFGDVIVSPFLEEVIAYAYDQSVILVASAGNDGSNTIHYPAGFAKTISVGATNQNDQRCSFSNWGQTLDLVAPGCDILTTMPQEGYRSVQGTSFSAPMVSAAAALVLSKDISYSNEQVRNILKTSCKDFGLFGWDEYFGAGLVDMYISGSQDKMAMLRIDAPLSGSSTAATTVPLCVTAQNADLKNLRAAIGLGANPNQWQVLLDGYRFQVIADTLLTLDLSSVTDTTIIIRLQVEEISGKVSEIRSILYIDRTPATISSIQTRTMIAEDHHVVLISFITDDIATAALKYHSASTGDRMNVLNFPYRTRNHNIRFEPDMGSGRIDFMLEIKNASDLLTVSEQLFFELPNTPIPPLNMNETEWRLPAGYLLNTATDFDHDNQLELVLSLYDDNQNFGPLNIFEFTSEGFQQKFKMNLSAIPRSWGDADGDGRSELLAGYGENSYLLESSTSDDFPEKIIWQDTSGFWASRITDLDQDGRGEILGRREKSYILFEAVADDQFQQIFSFDNPSQGENLLGPPTTVVTDLDKDAHAELVFGDYDGDIIIYEHSSSNQYQLRYVYRLPLPDATDYLLAGFFLDRDTPLLLMGCHTEPSDNYEREFDAQYWHFEFLAAPADNHYTIDQSFDIYGYYSTKLFDSGMGSLINDSNAAHDLLLALYPNLYLFRNNDQILQPAFFFQGVRTNTVVTCDLDKNGSQEIYLNKGTEIAGFQSGNNHRPLPPYGFTAYPEDSIAIKLQWQPVSGASYYRIFKGTSAQQLQLYDSTEVAAYYDDTVIFDLRYYYAIQTVAAALPVPTSLLSQIQNAKTNYPPRIEQMQIRPPNKIELYFTEQMDGNTFQTQNFSVQSGTCEVEAAVSLKNDWGVLLAFSPSFRPDEVYSLQIKEITDRDKTKIDIRDSLIAFTVAVQAEKPYIKTWTITESGHLMLNFNVAMDTATTLNRANYTLEPAGSVRSVREIDLDHKQFELYLDNQVYLGATGMNSYLTCTGLQSMAGMAFDTGNRISLVVLPQNLDQLYVYPQPVQVRTEWLMFANVVPETEIDIFDIHGMRIRHLADTQKNGGIQWDLCNDNGDRIATGVYFFYARSSSQNKTGKLVIVR
jgi:subtilisin family serine protease